MQDTNEQNQLLKKIINHEDAEMLIENTHPFQVLMTQYRCAMLEIKTKLDVLNEELSLDGERNPFESISCRLKKPLSILEKMERKGLPVTVENIEKNIKDVAGIRVVCSFKADIYRIADRLCSQDDVKVLERKDYIAEPKPNGYRSLHLILEIPVFLYNEKKFMCVEVQFRTIAMDFWASLEHKVRYKKNLAPGAEPIAEELRQCAELISAVDIHMQQIRDRIETFNNAERLKNQDDQDD